MNRPPWIAQKESDDSFYPGLWSIYSEAGSTYDGEKYTDDPVAVGIRSRDDALAMTAVWDLLEVCEWLVTRSPFEYSGATYISLEPGLFQAVKRAVAKAKGEVDE